MAINTDWMNILESAEWEAIIWLKQNGTKWIKIYSQKEEDGTNNWVKGELAKSFKALVEMLDYVDGCENQHLKICYAV